MTRLLPASSSTTAALVVAISTGYAVCIFQLLAVAASAAGDTEFGDLTGFLTLLRVIGVVFTAIAVAVSSATIANCYSAVTARRLPDIALRRLLGSSASRERRRILREGLRTAVLAGLVGCLVGVAGAWLIQQRAVTAGIIDAGDVRLLSLSVPVIGAAAVLSAVASIRRGSRATLSVTPLQALSTAVGETTSASDDRRRLRRVDGTVLAAGGVILGGGALAGMTSPNAVLLAALGGMVLLVGLVRSAPVILPRVLVPIARLIPSGSVALLVTREFHRHPVRVARSALGVVISITVISMFDIATATVDSTLASVYGDTGYAEGLAEVLRLVDVLVVPLVTITAIISALGVVSTTGTSIMARRREMALLRILGQSKRRTVQVLVAETAVIVIGSVLIGLLLGIVLAWAGAQAAIGSIDVGIWIRPVIPLSAIALVAVAGALLTALATAAPVRLALKPPPMRAFLTR